MARVRISEIANEVGYPSKEVIDKALELGIKVESQLDYVSLEDAEKIYEYINSGVAPKTLPQDDLTKYLKQTKLTKITFGQLYSENIYEVSGFQSPSKDGWLNMLALSDTLSYPIEKCLEAFYGYGILKIEEIDGIYNAWLVDKQEVNKRISWILEYNDPKRYLDGLIRNAGQFPTEAYPEFNYENYI